MAADQRIPDLEHVSSLQYQADHPHVAELPSTNTAEHPPVHHSKAVGNAADEARSKNRLLGLSPSLLIIIVLLLLGGLVGGLAGGLHSRKQK